MAMMSNAKASNSRIRNDTSLYRFVQKAENPWRFSASVNASSTRCLAPMDRTLLPAYMNFISPLASRTTFFGKCIATFMPISSVGGRIMKEPIGQGRTADIFEHPENAGLVIKVCKPHIPEEDVRREFHIAALAFSLGVPTPQPFEIVRENGRWGIVFERATGESLLKRMLGKPWSFRRHARKLAALHHALHTRKLDGQQPADRLLPRQKDVLKQHILSASALSEDEKQIAIARLEQLPDGDRLCHGDFHPDNVMTGEKDWMLDWVNGM